MQSSINKIFISCVFSAGLLFVLIICKGNENLSDFDLSAKKESQLEQLLVNAHIPEYHYQIISSYPHDKHSFTEGLVLANDYIYESSGLYGQSTLRKIQMNTGKILKEYSLPPHYFAEGITLLEDQIYQLTYHEQTGFVYDINSFQVKNTFSYQSEGWGLTTDGHQLIMSNGSAAVSFINPRTFKLERTVPVTVEKNKIDSLNELEFINGRIFANIWPTSIIVVFSPQDGKVTGWLNIKALKPGSSCMECVANGIAFDARNNLVLVTGKNWPYLYALKLVSGMTY